MIKSIFVVFALFEVAISATTYTNTLTDCNTFADLFDNTCDNDASIVSVSSMTGADVTCTISDNCVGTDDNGECTWTRKLCVSCSGSENDPYIRVQTNGLPPHCYTSPMDSLGELDVDWTVKFQPLATEGEYNNEATTVSELNDLICDITVTKEANIPAASDFTDSSTTEISTMTGVSITGVSILNGISAEGVDPLYPEEYGSVTDSEYAIEHFDACLAHPGGDGGIYHYHVISPCQIDYTVGELDSCDLNADCSDDPLQYFLDYWNSSPTNTLYPVGIAKDGYIIWGPYKEDGTIWDDCDVDICGGLFIDGTNYGYVGSTFHPYYAGCFGPANYATNQWECSANPRTCTTVDAALYIQETTFALIVFLAATFF